MRATLLALLTLLPAVSSQETVRVRRLSDTVSVRHGAERAERALYYFSPTADLAQGDEVEQGSGGHSTVLMSGGGLVDMLSSAHLVVERLDPEQGDVIFFRVITQARVTAGDRRITIRFAGGSQAVLQNTSVKIKAENGRGALRNAGSEPITVLGFMSLEPGEQTGPQAEGFGQLTLERGQEVSVPLIQLEPVRQGVRREEWGRLAIRQNGGYLIEPSENLLTVRPLVSEEAPEYDVLVIGGVRTWLAPGQALAIRNARADVQEALPLPADGHPVMVPRDRAGTTPAPGGPDIDTSDASNGGP